MKENVADKEAKTGHVALKAFFAIGERWGCSNQELKQLLGDISDNTLEHYRGLPEEALPEALLLRISHVIGIYRAVGSLFQNVNDAHQHIRRQFEAEPFNGSSALDHMLEGSEENLKNTRRYFDYFVWH